MTWLALVLILIPGLFRFFTGDFLTETKSMDFFLVLFLLSAGLALWSAYDGPFALRKFWILLSGGAIFYALARQPVENRGIIWGLVAIFPVLIAGYFLLTHDWLNTTVKIEPLSQLGAKWMSIRPVLSLPALLPNRAAGLIGLYLPFLFAQLLRTMERRNRWLLFILTLGACIALAGILLTVSRGSWIALMFAFVGWFILVRGKKTSDKFRKAEFISFAFVGFLLAGVSVMLLISGQESGISRLELFRQGLYLARDFPFIGAGLGSFPGLYSRYIRIIPNFFFSNGHNIFLDIAIEQGLAGIVAFSGMVLLTVRSMLNFTPNQEDDGAGHFRYAILASVFFLCVHGFVTDTLYAEQAMPLLFVQAGAAAMLRRGRRTEAAAEGMAFRFSSPRAKTYMAYLLLAAPILLLIFWFRPVAGAWTANQAAIRMAKIELTDFPRNAWEEGEKLEALQSVRMPILRALYLDEANHSANYRAGLLSLEERDFAAALPYLEKAFLTAPGHRGIVKSLGFCYVWLGSFSEAAGLLKDIPEAQEELKVYVWWWQTQEREDLSELAHDMLLYLEKSGVHP